MKGTVWLILPPSAFILCVAAQGWGEDLLVSDAEQAIECQNLSCKDFVRIILYTEVLVKPAAILILIQ
jgi:hypothetical protein